MVVLTIEGMTCAACVGAVERGVRAVKGVNGVTVSLMGKSGKVMYDDGLTTAAEIVAAVK